MEMLVQLVKLTMRIVVAQEVLSKMPIVMVYVMQMMFAMAIILYPLRKSSFNLVAML